MEKIELKNTLNQCLSRKLGGGCCCTQERTVSMLISGGRLRQTAKAFDMEKGFFIL